MPPMHSALKHDGKPLYDYARAGIELEREPRRVTIHSIAVIGRRGRSLDDRRLLQQGHVHPHAGRGHRRGARLRRAPGGAAAHRQRRPSTRLRALDRSDLAALSPAELDRCLLPVDALIADWPKVVLHAEDAGRFLAGVRRRSTCPIRRAFASTDPAGAFLGTAHVAGGELIAAVCSARSRSARSSRADSPPTRRIRKPLRHDPPDPKHRHHRPRRPWQDDAGRPAAAPERHLPRQREGRRAGDGLERPREGARHHDPGQELRRRVEGHARQHRRYARPRRLRRRGRARAVDGRLACCCWSTRSRGRCRRLASSPRRRSRSA